MFLLFVVYFNMYLNIVNNLSFENNRKKEFSRFKKDNSNEIETENIQETKYYLETGYNSIFFGELTQNWLKVTS
tara:strand:- start:372 stop:593 length:222 start_codon:yes stop_codon:yes gene_type:complete